MDVGPRQRMGITADLLRAGRGTTAEVEQRRAARLQALVRHARVQSPFYRDLYRGLSEGTPLEVMPPVSKPQLMAAFDEWVTDPRITRAGVERFIADPTRIGQPYAGCFVCSSSGTTGHPGIFVHDALAVAVYQAMVLRIDTTWLSGAQWLGLARRGSRWATVAGTGAHYAGTGWIEWERRRSWWRRHAFRMFSVQQPLHELAAALDAFDPAILTGYPSALLQLAEEQRAGRLHVRPTLVELAGESMGPAERARVAAAFGVPVHDAYGASECQVLAIDCAAGWLHVMADWVVLEPVDAELQPIPAGEQSHTVLLTNLANHVQPIIRYDLGDSVLARPDPCPCGSPMPAIRVAGRRDDVLRLATPGSRVVEVLPLALGSVLEQTPGLHRSQVVQTGPAALLVRLEPAPGADGELVWHDAADGLRRYLATLGLAAVAIERSAEPPERNARSGKFRHVIAGSGWDRNPPGRRS
jgi:phenylacetate-coenzyme A ligase PaaK-like adenylate-forming protein